MKNLCFYFQVHQPYRLNHYRFFDIGHHHNYFNEFDNRQIMNKVAQKCYLPTNQLFLDLIEQYGESIKISYSISGTALDQFKAYAPQVLESFQKLVATGQVELLSETYSHSISSLVSPFDFKSQVSQHKQLLKELFDFTPKVFRNTELIYSDEIGAMVYDMGYNTMLAEGADQILGWRSPNFLYKNFKQPNLKLLLKNYKLSDDIAFRFSNRQWEEWPLTTEKFVHWLNSVPENESTVNLFMDYETFGEHQWAETGIFEFLKALPKRLFESSDFIFSTPSEVASSLEPVDSIHVPHPISWADEERNLTAWLGNYLQDEAFHTLYSLKEKVHQIKDPQIQKDWLYLQTSDHFYYMCTKFFSDGDVHKYFNHYDTPYDAFINYMNVLNDFIIRVDSYKF